MRATRAALSCASLALACLACAAPARLTSLDLEAKAAQVLLVGVEGAGLPSPETLSLLESMPLGGVVLFSHNLTGKPIEAGRFTAALQAAAARGWGLPGSSSGKSPGRSLRDLPIPLIVAIDHEGGSVFRFKSGGITRVPPPFEVGRRGERYASLLGHAAGAELRALGINMALAPVVELLTDDNAAFLGSRSYGPSGPEVDASAGAYIDGLQAEMVAAVAKHFPGNAGEDPHKVLPELDLSETVYARDYLPRFAAAGKRRVSSVMLSHVIFKAVDPKRPASLSPDVIQGELRRRLGFRGLAITDDIGMRALAATYSPEKAAVDALSAGADLIMLVDMRAVPAVRKAIVAAVKEGRLPAARLAEAAGRVLELKLRFNMSAAFDLPAREKALAGYPTLVREDAKRLMAFRDAPMINR